MRPTKLIKIADREFRVSGAVKYSSETVKTVTVDGEEYCRSVWQDYVFDYDENFNSPNKSPYWTLIELNDLECVGIPAIKIHDYQGWRYKTALGDVWHEQSTNYAVNIYLHLKEEGLLPEKDVYVFNTKDPVSNDRLARKKLLENGEMQIVLFGYGYGNFLVADVSAERFLSGDFSRMSWETRHAYKGLIPEIEKMDVLDDETKFKVANRLLTFQTNNHVEHKQRTFFTYLQSNGTTGAE